MTLIEIDVVRLESAQARVASTENVVLRFIANAAVLVVMPEADFRRDIIVIARTKFLERAPQEFLAPSPAVHIGGIEEINAEFDRAFDRRDRLLVAGARPTVRLAIEHDRPAKLPAADPQ